MAMQSGAAAPPPPTALLSEPVAVLSPQYCVEYPVNLTMTQKALSLSGGDYAITDINGNPIFHVKGKAFSLHGQRTLIDTAGNTVLTMRGKIMSTHDRWQIFRGASTDLKDRVFSARRSKVMQLKTELDVFLAANTTENVCDFKVKGNYYMWSCIITLGDSNAILAQMKEQYQFKNIIRGKDMFAVTVYPKVDYAFIAALIVILDDIDRSGMYNWLE